MDIKVIIVKEYLESLTENEELDAIFPLLLEAMGFTILSVPKVTKGFAQYGKDIVAVGNDFDDGGKLKRFYFEIKGGYDKDITTQTYNKNDGIRESINEAIDKDFETTYPNFEKLPLKIILVHNGIIKPNIEQVFNGFIKKSFPPRKKLLQFDRWDISRLTILFAEHFFNSYLLTNNNQVKLFNRTLINLESYEGVSPDFIELVKNVLWGKKWTNKKGTLPRNWQMTFETIKLISLIIYTNSKDLNNIDIAKRYLSRLLVDYWHWVLKNNAENNKEVINYFGQIVAFYFHILDEYFKRVFDFILLNDGISNDRGGRYEQIGFTIRTFEVLQYLFLYEKIREFATNKKSEKFTGLIIQILNKNNVSARPLLDIHSIPITEVLLYLIREDDVKSARSYISNILQIIFWAKDNYNKLPDANNNVENVIKLILTQVRPIYYSDSTSPLLNVLFEFIAILDMEEEYHQLRDFVIKNKIDLGLFIPHHRINSNSMHLIEDVENDLEEQLFSKSVRDGYQSELKLTGVKNEDWNQPICFEEFKIKIKNRADEFSYDYRTDKAGFPFLKDLAHIIFTTPYFPDKWRKLLK